MHNKRNDDPMGDNVAFAFTSTSRDQRILIAEEFEAGKNHTLYAYANLLRLSEDGLLLASLLDTEHPAVCFEGGKPKHTNYGKLLTLVHAYVPVDKPVDKPV